MVSCWLDLLLSIAQCQFSMGVCDLTSHARVSRNPSTTEIHFCVVITNPTNRTIDFLPDIPQEHPLRLVVRTTNGRLWPVPDDCTQHQAGCVRFRPLQACAKQEADAAYATRHSNRCCPHCCCALPPPSTCCARPWRSLRARPSSTKWDYRNQEKAGEAAQADDATTMLKY